MIAAQQFLLHDSQCFYRYIFNKQGKKLDCGPALRSTFPCWNNVNGFYLQSSTFSNQLTILIVQKQGLTLLRELDSKRSLHSWPKMLTQTFRTLTSPYIFFQKLKAQCCQLFFFAGDCQIGSEICLHFRYIFATLYRIFRCLQAKRGAFICSGHTLGGFDSRRPSRK